tara:strand:+ start:575 stop:2026 length:1452 start_codon:yes stop_codon:yes gene_type:complete
MSVNDRIATQIKRYTKITPSNASGSGRFSFSGGNPIIRLSIAEQDAFLLAPETRLQFKFRAFKDSTKTNSVGSATAGSADAGEATTINIDPKIGVQAIINTLTISSRRYATSICEQIHNYNQLVSVAHPSLKSTRDLATHKNHEQMCVGQGILDRSEYGARLDKVEQGRVNNLALQQNYLKSIVAVASNAGQAVQNEGIDCSIQLYAGMFMSDNIDLRLMGGLEIEISLAPDANVFNAATSNTCYEISDVILNAPLLYKSANQMAQGIQPATLQFLTWSSLYNVIQSTNATITNKVGLRGALSMVQKFVPIAYLNNPTLQRDGVTGCNAFAGWNVGIKRLTYHRNGQRFPNEYQIITNRGDLEPPKEVMAEKTPMVLINSLSAFENYKDVKHTHLTSQNLDDRQNGVYFLGVSFDQISGQGIDLSGGTISTELESSLQDPSPTLAAITEVPASYPAVPFGVFTFFLNKNTLVVQPNQRIQSIE